MESFSTNHEFVLNSQGIKTAYLQQVMGQIRTRLNLGKMPPPIQMQSEEFCVGFLAACDLFLDSGLLPETIEDQRTNKLLIFIIETIVKQHGKSLMAFSKRENINDNQPQ